MRPPVAEASEKPAKAGEENINISNLNDEERKKWITGKRREIERLSEALDAMEKVGRYAPVTIRGEIIQ